MARLPALRLWGVFALLLAVAAVPLFSTELPALFDYPNHLSRMHLLATGGNRFYEVRWAALPNLAEDLIVPPLARLMPLALAAKLFVVATFALLAGGVLWLNRIAAGGWRWWPLAAFLFLYTRTFLWGFLNFLFGVGCALCGTGLWLALEERRAVPRVLVSTIAALVCFFSHLAAFGVYALAIVGVELPPAIGELRERRWRALAYRLGVLAPQFLIPAALLSQQLGGGAVAFAAPWRKLDLLFSVLDNYSRPFDIACFAAFVVLMLALAVTRRLDIERRLGAALGLVVAAYLLLPSQLMAGSAADHRLPAAGVLLLVAASRPVFPSRRSAILAGAAVALVLTLRIVLVEQVWRGADATYRGAIAGIDRLPEGARLAVAFPPGAVNFTPIPTVHLATLAVARRDAFVPTLFADASRQPIVVRPPFAAAAAAAMPELLWAGLTGGEPAARTAALRALAAYDYLAFTDRQALPILADRCLEPMFSAPRFAIFAIRRGAGCDGS